MYRIIASENIFKNVLEHFDPIADENVLLYSSKNTPDNLIQVKTKEKEFTLFYINSIKNLSNQDNIFSKYDYIWINCNTKQQIQNFISRSSNYNRQKGVFLCNKFEEMLVFLEKIIELNQSNMNQILIENLYKNVNYLIKTIDVLF